MNKKKIITILSSVTSLVIAIGASLLIGAKIKYDNLPTYIVTFDTSGGSLIDPIEVKKGYKIPKPNDPIKEGYHVENWLHGNDYWDFEYDIVYKDMTLKADWGLDRYIISYDFAGGTYSGNYKTTYDIDCEFSLIRPTKSDSVFVGWFDESGHRIDKINKGMTGNINLHASWEKNLFLQSLDPSKGIIEAFRDEYQSNKITVKNIGVNNKYHTFIGWYDENGSLLSSEDSFSFTVDGYSKMFIYSSYFNQEEENQWNLQHGVLPTINDEKTIIKYGMYPQNNVSDDETIEKLNKSQKTEFNDYYYLNHEYFQKKVAILAKKPGTSEPLDFHCFDNGKEIVEGNEYWFKVEPIEWLVISKSDNKYSLLSNKLIDVKRFDAGKPHVIDTKIIPSNNYELSEIRHWLNSTFISLSFFLNENFLETVLVDNSPDTTATPDYSYDYANTNDRIYLLSYADYVNRSLSNRKIRTTDFARSSRANYSTDLGNLYNGYYWTRSQIFTQTNNGYVVSRCNKNGTLNSDYVGYSESCVQPAINIKV